MRFLRSILVLLMAAVLISTTGCESMNNAWDYLFGAEDTGPGGSIPGPLEDPGPGDWTTGELAPRGGEWVPDPAITLPTIYFAYDQSRIGTSERVKLEQVADYLIRNNNIGVIIEGHCDERGGLEYNRALGEKRALSVKDYLVRLGVAESRFQTISYGEERPAAQGSTESAYSKNRRAELIGARIN